MHKPQAPIAAPKTEELTAGQIRYRKWIADGNPAADFVETAEELYTSARSLLREQIEIIGASQENAPYNSEEWKEKRDILDGLLFAEGKFIQAFKAGCIGNGGEK